MIPIVIHMFIRIPQHYFNCFEWDEVPVDTRMSFHGEFCQDKMGNKYQVSKEYPDPAQLTSCCQCLEYKLSTYRYISHL